MANDGRQNAYSHLLGLAEQNGFVTVDDIIDAAEKWELPLSDVDRLSNSITTQGIIVYDVPPEKTGAIDEFGEFDDFAQCDYYSIFRRVIELEPSLEPFIKQIRSIQPPQYKEFSSLIYQAKEGNQYARNRIIEMNLRLAVRIGLQRSEQYDADIVDCIGDACLGLIRAVNQYDTRIKRPFSSYASMWMFQSVTRNQTTQRPDVYYPVHEMEKYFLVYPMLRDKGCTTCDSVLYCRRVKDDIRNRVACSDKQVEGTIFQSISFESVDAIEDLYADGNSEDDLFFGVKEDKHIARVVEKMTDFTDVSDDIIYRDMKTVINEVLKSMTPKEEKVIRERFGLDGDQPKTLEEIGKQLGVSRERIRQIEAKAMRKLKHPSRMGKLSGYL